MRSLTDLPLASLEWRRGGAACEDFELHSNNEVVATLTFLDEDMDLARAETAEGTWTFKHAGLLGTSINIREEGDHANLATFHPHPMRHGKVLFADGAAFDWADLPHAAAGSIGGGAFLALDGTPLLRLHAHPGRDRDDPPGPDSGVVALGLAPPARWRHAILAALGWYLLVTLHLRERQAADSQANMGI